MSAVEMDAESGNLMERLRHKFTTVIPNQNIKANNESTSVLCRPKCDICRQGDDFFVLGQYFIQKGQTINGDYYVSELRQMKLKSHLRDHQFWRDGEVIQAVEENLEAEHKSFFREAWTKYIEVKGNYIEK